jgi:hypothetical protein
MVLGVDDFTQEFAYLSGRDQWLARDLIGYGTANGLEVEIQGLEVIVHPGVALSPAGQLIRVPSTQCARLDQWAALDKNRQQLPQNGIANLYVVLCYRECPTDLAPIPGEPCRSEEETMQPSRLADDFKLELRFQAPEQCEEDALREFVEWLHASMDITDAGTDFISLEDFLRAIRDAVNTTASPPCSSPFFLLDSLPLGLHVHTDDLCEFLRAAFRLWVTELRPLWKADYLSRWQGCAGETRTDDHPQEDCVLLAELRVPFAGGAINIAGAVIDEARRPYLVHLRMLQEWVLCGKAGRAAMALDDLTDVTVPTPQNGQALVFQNGEWVAVTLSGISPGGPAGGDLTGTYPNPQVAGILGRPINPLPNANNQLLVFNNAGNRWESRLLLLDELSDVNAPAPLNGQVLTRQGAHWVAATPAAGGATGPAGGDLSGTYPNPTVRALQTRVVANTAPTVTNQVLSWNQAANQWEPRLHNLDDLGDVNAGAPVDGQVLTRQAGQWVAAAVPGGGATGPAGGDLSGTYPNPTVSGLQTRAVANSAPDNGDLLTWNARANRWEPRALAVTLPFVTIDRVQDTNGIFYDLWFHLDAPTNGAEIPRLVENDMVQVAMETTQAPSFLRRINVTQVAQITRNLFRATLQQESDLLRFTFDVNSIGVLIGGAQQRLLQYIIESGMKFQGFDGGKTITAFVRGRRG